MFRIDNLIDAIVDTIWMKSMKKLILITLLILNSACSSPTPDCASKPALDTLTSLIKEQVLGNEDTTWYIEPKFDIVSTTTKLDNGYQCYAQIIFSIPSEWQNSATKKINVDYTIRKNEASKDSFSVSTTLDYDEIKQFNDLGWTANQGYLYKKSGLVFFTQDSTKQVSKTLHDWLDKPNNDMAGWG